MIGPAESWKQVPLVKALEYGNLGDLFYFSQLKRYQLVMYVLGMGD